MKQRSPTLRHKLRYLTRSNITGDSIGITLPKELLIGTKKLESFIGVTFYVSASGGAILLESGCKVPQELMMKDINKLILEEKKIII
jgi:hypothetical protein